MFPMLRAPKHLPRFGGSVGRFYHAFCNTGSKPNRHLEIHAPGEFEDYYDEYERLVESAMGEEERTKARAKLGERYGVTWHEELIPEVRACFGLES